MAKPSIKQYIFRAGAAKRVPVSGTFELTARCNLNCRMCYIHMSPEEQSACGKELSAAQWLQLGRQAVDAGMVYLLITGGEPMLRPDFPEIYTEMVKMGVKVSINTNGTLITPAVLECFRKFPPETVNVTVYGASSATYHSLCGVASGYEKAIQGILSLKEAGIRVNINTTFTSCNEADLEQLATFARENGLPIRTAAYVYPKVRNGQGEQTITLSPEDHGRLTARFDSLVLSAERLGSRRRQVQSCIKDDFVPEKVPAKRPSGCMAGRGAFWITWEGKMLSCGMLSNSSANILQKPFQTCWNEITAGMTQVYLPEECSVCPYDPICPVCAALTQSLNGDSAAVPKEMCRYIRAYSEAFLSLTEGLEPTQGFLTESEEESSGTCIL